MAPATQKQGSHSPLPPLQLVANATPDGLGANATPVPDQWHHIFSVEQCEEQLSCIQGSGLHHDGYSFGRTSF